MLKLKNSVTLLVAFSVLATASCSSAKKQPPTVPGGPGQPKAVVPTAPPLSATKEVTAHAVTSLGDNRAPKFSPDGSKLLFLSSNRPSHRHAQVYELDLLRMTERRVTFHDGDDEGANWDGPTKIVYSSTTDEMKEDVSLNRIKADYEASKSAAANPNGMRAPPKVVNGGEIYLQRLDGRAIQRVTDQPGPDTSPTANGSRIVFVSSRSGDPQLFLSNEDTLRPVTHGPDAAPAFSYDGKSLAWERTIQSSSQIFMTDDLKSALPLTSPGFIDRQPAWNGKGDAVAFSSNRAGKSFDLYLIDRKASCFKRLTEVQGDVSWPTLSPDGSKIAFSTKVNGVSQIFLMDDKSAGLPCVTPPASKP